MKKTFFITLLSIFTTLAVAQDLLVPHEPIFNSINPNKIDFLETEYLLGGNYNGVISFHAFGGGYSLTYNKHENILFYAEYKKCQSRQLFCDSLMDVIRPELLHRYKMKVPDSVVFIIKQLIDAARNTSSYLFETNGFDGTTFYFEPHYKTAYCWSPRGRCGELVEALYSCGRGVASGNLDSVLSIMPKCHQLLFSFRRDYPNKYDEQYGYPLIDYYNSNRLNKIARKLFTETDCLLPDEPLQIKVNKQNHNLLIVDESRTLYLDSRHLEPDSIFAIAQHIKMFAPGEYRFDPKTKTFRLEKEYKRKEDSDPEISSYEDFFANDDEYIEEEEGDSIQKEVEFPLLEVIDKELYHILENSEKIFAQDSVPGNYIILSYDKPYCSIKKSIKIPQLYQPLGYFKWQDKIVCLECAEYISNDGRTYCDTLNAVNLSKKKNSSLFIDKKDFGSCSYPLHLRIKKPVQFVVDNGKVTMFLPQKVVEQSYRKATMQILEEKGLTLDEVYVSSSLSPIPSQYTKKKRSDRPMRSYQDTGFESYHSKPFESPFCNLNSVVEKASFKLSVIDDGYFVIRYTDQQGNIEYYCYQIGEDYSVNRLNINN